MLPSSFNNLSPEIQIMLRSLPPACLHRIVTPPERGNGHRELFRDACAMKRAGFSAHDQQAVLRARYENFYRDVSDREIDEAIASAASSDTALTPRWPEKNCALVEEIVRSGGSLGALAEGSPIPNPETLPTGKAIDRLLPQDALLCFGRALDESYTARRERFSGREHTFPLVVPNTMSALTGHTKANPTGRPSSRTLENTGPRLNQVIEFDQGSLDEQASLLLHLRKIGPTLRAAVFSGNRSVHGWFDVEHWTEPEVQRFQRYAAALGADRATFTKCQFVRTPNARRENGNLQKLIYLS